MDGRRGVPDRHGRRVVPIASVDRRALSAPGPLTRRAQHLFAASLPRAVAALKLIFAPLTSRAMLLGVDVGGTFTDAVLAAATAHASARRRRRLPARRRSEDAGGRDGARGGGREPAAVEAFAHGTTVTTNALLEGRAARTALLATAGFTDVVEFGRQARADLYRLCAAHPAPLVPDELRFAVDERSGPHGPIRAPRGLAESRRAVRARASSRSRSCSCTPPRSRRMSSRRGRAARASRASTSRSPMRSAPTPREYERWATTEIDAALSPLLRGHLERPRRRCESSGCLRPAVMQSSGGLTSAAAASAHAAFTVLSGPAGGAPGRGWRPRASGAADVLCFDMGGTSCDVCVIDAGEVRETDQRVIAGRPIALPSLDIETVGAGGGSIAWRDSGGALRVGPRSAGATPGPAAYGRGGTEATVTDAHVVLGHLPQAAGARGRGAAAARCSRTPRSAASRAALGLEPLRAAQGILAVADAEMLGRCGR